LDLKVLAAERQAEVGREQGGAGLARIGFEASGGRTRLARLEQRAPLRVLFPRVCADELVEAVLLNIGGGVVGGDRLAVEVEAGPGAQVRLTTQAAERIYRSAGPSCALEVRLRAGRDAWLEWLPQETILFDRCRIGRQLVLDLAPGARALAGEVVVFGRAAHGEALSSGAFSDRWWLCRGGRLLWADALRLDGALAPCLAAPFGFAGARAMATLVLAAEDAAAWLEPARALGGAGEVTSGLTCLPGVLIGRWLGVDAQAVRAAYGAFVARLRALVAGLPPRLPAMWQS
jgi:urease accessory protein